MANINMLPETHVFDETGKLAENYIPNERCVLENRNVRALAPKFGSFFTDSLKIRDANGKAVPRAKYQFGLFNEVISAKVGKEIAGAIIILDKSVAAPLYIDYQCVGGPWGATNERIMELFAKLMTDNRPVAWPDILGKPDEYKPAHHWQDIGDLYGAEYWVAALERLTNAILMGDNASHDEIWRRIDEIYLELRKADENLLIYVNAELAKKADKIWTTEQLALNADKTWVTAELAKKADLKWTTDQLALKADKTWVTAELAKKADLTWTTAELNKKADKVYVDAELAKKADLKWTTDQLALKADKVYVDAELAKKADKTWVTAELAKKADKTYVDAELNKKADLTYVNAELQTKATKNELTAAVTNLTNEINKGVGVASTNSISMTGNGKSTPITSNLKLSTRTGNRLQIDTTGVGVWDTAPPNLSTQYVDYVAGKDTNAGTRASPLKTLAAALSRVSAAGGMGWYTIFMKAGQTHVINQPLAGVSRGTISLVAYGDSKYPHELYDGGPGYYWWTAADYPRPVLDFRIFTHPNYPQYAGSPVLNAGSLYLRGLQINLPSAPPTVPGHARYSFTTEDSMGRMWSQGCNYNFRGPTSEYQSIARGGVFVNQNCNLMNFPVSKGASQRRFMDSMLMMMPGGDYDYDYDIVPLDSRLPTFRGRRSSLASLLRPWNYNSFGYNEATKTMYGTTLTHDVFAY